MSSEQNAGPLIVNCGGGLGNQMFEYAAGLYFSGRAGKPFAMVRPRPQDQQWNGYPRPFQLNEFHIRAEVRDMGTVERLFFSDNPRFVSARRIASSLLRAELMEEPAIYQFSSELQPTPGKTTYIKGNWQAAGYVQAVETKLREDFTLKSPMAGKNLEYAQQIAQLTCPVSVHLRIGDYALITHPTGEGEARASMVLGPLYYERALTLALQSFPDATLVIFTDAPERARELLETKYRCLFIDGNAADSAYEDLRLMSLCRHHVIANSSFSWWGAWLNPRADKRVFAPKYWGNTRSSWFPDLFPTGWTVVENL